MLVHFFVNGTQESAAGERAVRIAARLGELETQFVFRNGSRNESLRTMIERARHDRPDVIYCMDFAAAPVLAACVARRCKVIIDTGDAPSDFLQLIGASLRSRCAAKAFERAGYWRADAFVVRGAHHETLLRQNGVSVPVYVIPDGVDRTVMYPRDVAPLRAALGTADCFTIGVQGNFTWYPKLGGGMGWDVVRAVAAAEQRDWRIVLIGDGPGVEALQSLAAQLHIEDQLIAAGRMPLDQLAEHLNGVDVTVLTQTNDPSSWVRTTGKLPCYLACGKPVLASRVGTAADLLPESMLADYNGNWDSLYPLRLADRLLSWSEPGRSEFARGAMCALAEPFDYDVIAGAAAQVVLDVWRGIAASDLQAKAA